MANDKLTAERVREVLHYDPSTGNFIWAKAISRKIAPGKKAGNVHPAGYLRIRIDGVMYKAHRLAWLYTHGKWPEFLIDHINGDNSDNRICNLRDVNHKQNMENRKGPSIKSTSGVLGVYWHKQNKNWRAQIGSYKQSIHLGCFSSKEEAIACRLNAEKQIFTHSKVCGLQSAYPDVHDQRGGKQLEDDGCG